MEAASPRLNMKIGILVLVSVLSLFAIIREAGAKGVGGNELVARLELSPVVVGRPSQIHWLFSNRDTGSPVNHRLTLTITHLEKRKRIFSLNKIPVKGNFTLGFHFTDASAHRVTSVAEVEGRGPIQQEQIITVTGLEPPREAILPALFFFLGVLALGLVTGRMSRKWIR